MIGVCVCVEINTLPHCHQAAFYCKLFCYVTPTLHVFQSGLSQSQSVLWFKSDLAHVYIHREACTYSYLNEAGVGHDLFRIYYVHQGLHHSDVPNTRHVKTIDVLPPCKHRENIFQDILKLVCVWKVENLCGCVWSPSFGPKIDCCLLCVWQHLITSPHVR